MEVDVSVCVGIYNAGIKELLLTTFSIVKQKKVSFEIIFADDGSENDYSAVIDAFFLYWPQVTYRYERSNVNRGTVNNFYSALRYARGKYVKLISPGDFFSYENALFDLVNVLKVQNMEACFSDAICYRKGVDSFTLSLLDQPKAFRVYEKNNKYLLSFSNTFSMKSENNMNLSDFNEVITIEKNENNTINTKEKRNNSLQTYNTYV